MNITFDRKGNELILTAVPENMDIHEILNRLDHGDSWKINHSFIVDKQNLRLADPEQNELQFCIGTVYDDYTAIAKEVLGTEHSFYFCNSIKLKRRHFVASRNISILAKIDHVVDQNVYIGGHHSKCIPVNAYELLIKKFPKSAELDYYAHARIATIIKEYLPNAERHEIAFDEYIKRQEKPYLSTISNNIAADFKNNIKTEFEQFSDIRSKLEELLKRSDGVSERMWQEQIHRLLRFLYPKYIAGIREVTIKGADHNKRPDFLLIDANGYVDILEIKKPDTLLLSCQPSYRNNYVPARELSGTIQQIENYIFCLNTWGKEGEQKLQKQLSSKLPANVTPKIINPQGILLLGRSNQFNHQQEKDFELIKRQYKHIAEIITYDDLLQRIDNITASLHRDILND